MIPSVCEIFGVTADEIINGERRKEIKTEADAAVPTQVTERIIIKEEKKPAPDTEGIITDVKTKLSVRLVIAVFASLFASAIAVGLMYGRMHELGIAISLATALGMIMYSIVTEIKILSETKFGKRDIGKTAFFMINFIRIKSVKNACLSGSIAVFITVVTAAYAHLGDIFELLLCAVFYAPPTLIGCGIIYAVIMSRLYKKGVIYSENDLGNR